MMTIMMIGVAIKGKADTYKPKMTCKWEPFIELIYIIISNEMSRDNELNVAVTLSTLHTCITIIFLLFDGSWIEVIAMPRMTSDLFFFIFLRFFSIAPEPHYSTSKYVSYLAEHGSKSIGNAPNEVMYLEEGGPNPRHSKADWTRAHRTIFGLDRGEHQRENQQSTTPIILYISLLGIL